MENDEDIKLPSLGPSALSDRDDIERTLQRNISSCWRGDDFDEERASHFLREALKEIFDLQMSVYHGNSRYEHSWIPAIIGVSFKRVSIALPDHQPTGGYYQRTSDLLHAAIFAHLHDSLSAEAYAATFPEAATALQDGTTNKKPNFEGSPSTAEERPAEQEPLVQHRAELLRAYKVANGDVSDRRIYTAQNSCIHKPEFLDWKKGKLPSSSATTLNFERFLRTLKPPIPRKKNRDFLPW